MDRNYYDSFQLTLAQHPSETAKRLMLRLVAYLYHANENLSFGRGVSDEDEAAIWQINYSDEIELWIELGQIEFKRIKKASNKAHSVFVYCYGSSADIWWENNKTSLQQIKNLTVKKFPADLAEQLEKFLDRNMELQCSIQDSEMWLTCGEETILIQAPTLSAE